MICDVCGVVDLEENPIFEILDESGFVIQRICMDCFLKEIEDGEPTA
jgi:hypothetical protein